MGDMRSATVTRREWVTCFLSCVFDLDAGQTVEACYPQGVLTPGESKGIAYGAFPESLTQSSTARNGVSDSNYAFRVKRDVPSKDHPQDKLSYLYCYVYARVRQDERMHRGAEQRSIILVSEHPYTSVLLPVSSTVGPALLQSFHDTAATLLQASQQLWPAPAPGTLTSVTIGPHRVVGRVPLDACLPHAETQLWQPTEQPNAPPSAAWAPLSGPFGEVCLARALQAHHKQLCSLWEVMLLGEPVMVFCSSPQRASTAVLALLALITPLPYEPDYRPLLSIHDPQVVDVQEGAPHTAACPVPTVYGVTNPYFLRACASCRNVMTIMHAPPALLVPGSLSRTGDLATADRHNNGSSTGRTLQMQSRRASSFADMSGVLSGHADGISLQPGLVCTAPDKHVLAKLKAAAESSSPAMWDSAGNTLRTHFFNLTVAFLMPFYDFCGVGCPWSSTHQAQHSGESGRGFQLGEFLTFLSSYKLSDTLLAVTGGKRKAGALYRAFIDGQNFGPWMQRVLNTSASGAVNDAQS